MRAKQSNPIPVQIVGGSNPGRANKISAEAAYNMIVEQDALLDYAGYSRVAVLEILAQARGIYASSLFEHLIVVVDDNIKIVTKTLFVAQIGELLTSTGDVYFAENGNSEIAISDNLYYYVYNYNLSTFAKVDIGFRPGYLTAQNGYIFAVVADSNTARYSDVNNATTWTVTNSMSIANDYINAVEALGDVLVWLVGTKYTVPYRNLGTAIAPYKKDSSINILYGTVNRNSIATNFGMTVWLGGNDDSNGTILMSAGGPAEQVSPPEIDYFISQLTHRNNCSAFIFKEDGHIFYQLTWPQDNKTLVYDFTSKSFLYATDENGNYHIAKDVAHFNGKYYFISFKDSNLYEMSSLIKNYNGLIIPRIRVCPSNRFPDYKYFRGNRLQVVAQQGQYDTPMHVDMSISRDGGVTFGNAVRKDLAPIGQRSANPLIWNKLGWGNDWTFQFNFYGLGGFVILGASLEIS